MKSIATSLAMLWLSAATAVAQENPVVVELYTSQGCSSCPPADALMHKLAEREDVIGLALHVDYWDYIGWKDEFADPAHTRRQQGFAQAGGRSMIYTPQMIINGQEDVVGARAMELMDLIDQHRSTPATVSATATRTAGKVTVAIAPLNSAVPVPHNIVFVRYTPHQSTRITRGELAGHTLDYANVVESWDRVGTWDGQEPLTLDIDDAGDLPAVVLVQRAGYGPIVAASRVN